MKPFHSVDVIDANSEPETLSQPSSAIADSNKNSIFIVETGDLSLLVRDSTDDPDPVANDPIANDPVANDPVANDPVANDPVANDPVANDPVVNEPVVNDPVANDPVVNDPVVNDPVANDPVVNDHIVNDHIANDNIVNDNIANGHIAYVVSSHALCLASPVWKKIIHPPFQKLSCAESHEDGLRSKQIDLHEDNKEALLHLLNIAHLQFNKVPTQLPFKSILDIAVLCDKYDCVGLVKPWLPLWLVDEETQYKEPDHEEWLFVAWVFGREKTFIELARKLVIEVRMSPTGVCLTSTGKIFPSQMPPGIVGRFNISAYILLGFLSRLQNLY